MVVELKKHLKPHITIKHNSVQKCTKNNSQDLDSTIDNRLSNLKEKVDKSLLKNSKENSSGVDFFNPSFLGELSLLIVSENISTVLEEIENRNSDSSLKNCSSSVDFQNKCENFLWDTRILVDDRISN